MYLRDVECYTGDVSQWIVQQIHERNVHNEGEQGFLSHIILDMPDADKHIAQAASVLRVDGNLLVFNPSISQIMTVVNLIKREQLLLQLDTVLELGHSMTGGREWDVRSVVPRARSKIRNEGRAAVTNNCDKRTDEVAEDDNEIAGRDSLNGEESGSSQQKDRSSQMVCRPKVGGLVRGGGFVGVWKKMKHRK